MKRYFDRSALRRNISDLLSGMLGPSGMGSPHELILVQTLRRVACGQFIVRSGDVFEIRQFAGRNHLGHFIRGVTVDNEFLYFTVLCYGFDRSIPAPI